MKLTTKQQKTFVNFLDEHKVYAGLSDWEVFVAIETKEMEEFAEVDPNIYEQTLKVVVSTRFLKQKTKKQCQDLFHELIHARVSVKEKRVEILGEQEEEYMVNDICRGFFKKLRFD